MSSLSMINCPSQSISIILRCYWKDFGTTKDPRSFNLTFLPPFWPYLCQLRIFFCCKEGRQTRGNHRSALGSWSDADADSALSTLIRRIKRRWISLTNKPEAPFQSAFISYFTKQRRKRPLIWLIIHLTSNKNDNDWY